MCDFVRVCVCVCFYCNLPRGLLGQAGLPFKFYFPCLAGKHPVVARGIGTQTRRLACSRRAFECGLAFFSSFFFVPQTPSPPPPGPPHSQIVSGVQSGFFFFWTGLQATVSPSGHVTARSRRDKRGRVDCGMYFWGHVYTMWHLPGGSGQLMVNYYVTSCRLLPPHLFFFLRKMFFRYYIITI